MQQMKKFLIFLIPLAIISMAFKSDKPAYQLFNQSGKVIKYSKMIKSLEDADIVLFGELHNNPIAHWLELEVARIYMPAKVKN
jgi:uncharacterized iron-regulated protein